MLKYSGCTIFLHLFYNTVKQTLLLMVINKKKIKKMIYETIKPFFVVAENWITQDKARKKKDVEKTIISHKHFFLFVLAKMCLLSPNVEFYM